MAFLRFAPLLLFALASTASATKLAPDLSTPISDSFPSVSGEVFAIATVSDDNGSGTIYIGGTFTEVGGVPRNNAAAFDIETGALKSWNPNVDGPVRALIVSGGIAYLGGAFSEVGGQTRNNLASINISTGAVRDWNPNVNGEVRALALVAGNLHVGGAFSLIGAESRPASPRSIPRSPCCRGIPPPMGIVATLLGVGNRLYAGGEFQNIAGSVRKFAAAFDISTGALANWNPAPNGIVRAFASDGNTIFVGGDFTEIAGRGIAYAAAVDPSSHQARDWNAGLNGSVHTVQYLRRALYLGGDFTRAAGTSRSRLAALESTTAAIFPWNPGANATVRAIFFQGGDKGGLTRGVTKSAVLLGGGFTIAGGGGHRGFAAVRDPMWSSAPSVTITRINGNPATRNLRRSYFTKRKRVIVSGIATSNTEVGKVFALGIARGKKAKVFVARGTSSWRATLRLRSRENNFLFGASDRFYDFPYPINTSNRSISVTRLDPGEKPPRR